LHPEPMFPRGHRSGALVALAVALVLALIGWGAVSLRPVVSFAPSPMEIPVGGVRASVVQRNLADTRRLMPGGVVEAGWLPSGFVLTQAEYSPGGAGEPTVSLDLYYTAGANHVASVHIWQTLATDLAGKDPVGIGQWLDIDAASWSALTLDDGRLQLSTRTRDGRTISLDGNLSADLMRRIAGQLVRRGG
jgi:hypothetical protein